MVSTYVHYPLLRKLEDTVQKNLQTESGSS
jgi:hypothetical protein